MELDCGFVRVLTLEIGVGRAGGGIVISRACRLELKWKLCLGDCAVQGILCTPYHTVCSEWQ